MTSITHKIRFDRKKANGKYTVSFLVIHNRVPRYRKTQLEVSDKDLDKKGNIINKTKLEVLNKEEKKLEEKICRVAVANPKIDIDELLRLVDEMKDPNELDFFDYFEHVWLKENQGKKAPGTLKLYEFGISKFKKYVANPVEDLFVEDLTEEQMGDNEQSEIEVKLPVGKLSGKLLKGFADALNRRWLFDGKYGKTRNSYPTYVRSIFKAMCEKYNDYAADIIVINDRQLSHFHSYPESRTAKRPLRREELLKFANLEVEDSNPRTRQNMILAREIFFLSFCLMGTNLVDLWNVCNYKNGQITYIRQKLASRRGDAATMEIEVPKQIQAVFDKYRDKSGQHVFIFQAENTSYKKFFVRVNDGLKKIKEKYGIGEDIHFTFYAARHTIATEMEAKYDSKSLVAKILCHSENGMETTDRYITVDMKKLNAKNKALLDDIFGEETIIKTYSV